MYPVELFDSQSTLTNCSSFSTRSSSRVNRSNLEMNVKCVQQVDVKWLEKLQKQIYRVNLEPLDMFVAEFHDNFLALCCFGCIVSLCQLVLRLIIN